MPHDFLLSSRTLPNGRTVHYAQLAGSEQARFVIGYRTMYEGNTGLFNTETLPELAYKPSDYESASGFWAYFIFPTANAESRGSFNSLNTYNRAKFSFSFMQFAAHIPNGDFIKFFKKLLALPSAKHYFPELVLQNDSIFSRLENGALKQLEDNSSTEGLMNFLNPSLNEIENQELINAARFVHWSANDPEHRKIQVKTAIEHFKQNLREYSKRFNLDGVPAKVCQLVCDIKHHGRSTNDRIAAALNTRGDYEKAYTNLLSIGATNYSTRINTVKNTINDLYKKGVFNKRYNASDNSFISI